MKKIENRKSKIENAGAFTLIELLIVISIIAILAAFIVTIGPSLKRRAYISKTQAEMAQVETAIENYHDALGFYPPDNPGNALVNQLYFELEGTVTNSTGFQTLDGSSTITTAGRIWRDSDRLCQLHHRQRGKCAQRRKFSVRVEADTDRHEQRGRRIARRLGRPGRIKITRRWPVPLQIRGVIVYPGINNPNGYDLWMQLVIRGQTNLVCNWIKDVQINFPLP